MLDSSSFSDRSVLQSELLKTSTSQEGNKAQNMQDKMTACALLLLEISHQMWQDFSMIMPVHV